MMAPQKTLEEGIVEFLREHGPSERRAIIQGVGGSTRRMSEILSNLYSRGIVKKGFVMADARLVVYEIVEG